MNKIRQSADDLVTITGILFLATLLFVGVWAEWAWLLLSDTPRARHFFDWVRNGRDAGPGSAV